MKRLIERFREWLFIWLVGTAFAAEQRRVNARIRELENAFVMEHGRLLALLEEVTRSQTKWAGVIVDERRRLRWICAHADSLKTAVSRFERVLTAERVAKNGAT